MTEGAAFDRETLALLATEREVVVETSRARGAPLHRTVVWVVVDEGGRVFVRSFRGERGRWYRELRANPSGAVVVGERRIGVTAVPATDPDSIQACSRALTAKYRTSRASLAAMVREEVLDTTLELVSDASA